MANRVMLRCFLEARMQRVDAIRVLLPRIFKEDWPALRMLGSMQHF